MTIAIHATRRALVAAVALLAPATLAAQTPVVRAASHTRRTATEAAPLAVVTLAPHRNRWALDVTVGGQPFHFGLDTGGGVTLITSRVADAAGCTPWGRTTGFTMFARRLDGPRCDDVAIAVGGMRVAPPVSSVTALETIEPNDKSLDGSLALDAFEGRAVTLDLGAGRLTVESPASLAARVRTMTPLPIRLQREMGGRALSIFVAVPSAKGPLWMELDSGNGGTVLVSKTNAALLGIDSTSKEMQRGAFDVLPGVRVETDRVLALDMTTDGNLGMPFLRHWIISVDFATARAWIAPTTAAGEAAPSGSR